MILAFVSYILILVYIFSVVLQLLMLPRDGEMHIHTGSNRPLLIQVKDVYHPFVICIVFLLLLHSFIFYIVVSTLCAIFCTYFTLSKGVLGSGSTPVCKTGMNIICCHETFFDLHLVFSTFEIIQQSAKNYRKKYNVMGFRY